MTPRTRTQAHAAFTLVELLISISIIAILLSIALGSIFVAQEAARVEKTRGLITKIDQIIMEKYESYRTRRVPLQLGTDRTGAAISPAETAQAFARRRLDGLRELMRMELPDRWSDILDAPVVLPATRPGLSAAYKRRYDATTHSAEHEGAECLYLILKFCGDERAAVITERNSGDKDGDDDPEVWDAWGNPINFIRWPAGFLNSAAANTSYDTGEPYLDANDNGSHDSGEEYIDGNYLTDLQVGDAATDPDPFDYRKRHVNTASPPVHLAYALYPLIYSSGPDGSPGINTVPTVQYSTTPTFLNNPYDATSGLVGTPENANSSNDYQFVFQDNIHNHLLGIR